MPEPGGCMQADWPPCSADGDLLVGSGPLSTDSSGTGTANLSLAAGIPGLLTASATRSNGDTSELSSCFQETDLIFAGGFD